MKLLISEHRCITCRHFDCDNNECTKSGLCLKFLKESEVISEVISECDNWEEKRGDEE